MKAPEKNINGSVNTVACSDPDLLAASEPQTFLYLHQCFERLVLQSSSQKVSGTILFVVSIQEIQCGLEFLPVYEKNSISFCFHPTLISSHKANVFI